MDTCGVKEAVQDFFKRKIEERKEDPPERPETVRERRRREERDSVLIKPEHKGDRYKGIDI